MILDLLSLHRAEQIYFHSCHNLCSGDQFFQDHDFFADLYASCEKRYDETIERAIGLFGESDVSLQNILDEIVLILKDAPSIGIKDQKKFLEYGLNLHEKTLKLINQLIEKNKLSQGTINLFAGHADQLEVEIYKLKQRMK